MLTIEDVEKAIAEKAPGSWIAGETSIWGRLSNADDDSGLFGLKISDEPKGLKPAADDLEGFGAAPLPESIDWRSHDGGRLSTMRDQGVNCGSCVGFATTAV